MTAPTSPKPPTPADPTVSKDAGTTLDSGAADAGLRTALTKLAVPMYYDATPGAYPVTAVPMSHLLSLLAAHPAPETDEDCTHPSTQTHAGITTCLTCVAAPALETDEEEIARAVARGYIDPRVRQGLSIRAYSAAVRPESPVLADDLDAWVGAPVSDPRREDVELPEIIARALLGVLFGFVEECSPAEVVYARHLARAVLAALPAPPVVDEAEIRAEAAKKAEKRHPSWHDNGVGIVQGSHWRAGYVEGYTTARLRERVAVDIVAP